MFEWKCLIIINLAVILLSSLSARAQPVEQVNHLYESTRDRGLEELLAAISTSDNGNYNVVDLMGKLPAGFEPNSKFQQVIRDPRVLKIYQLLRAMPKDDASKLISKFFDQNLTHLKSVASKGKADSRVNYGLHALLFLSLKIEGSQEFNNHFDKWHKWFVQGVAKRQGELDGPIPDKFQRSTFAANSPELLMYLNLVLMEQVRTGEVADDSEFAKILKTAGFRYPLSDLSRTMPIYPFDSEPNDDNAKPLFEVPLIPDWGDVLHAFKTHQRLRIFSEAKQVIDPKGPLTQAFENSANFLLTLGGIIDLDELQRRVREKQLKVSSSGTAIKLVGGDLPTILAQGWYPEEPPTKAEFSSAIDRIYQALPESKKDDWEIAFQQMSDWLEKVPEEGIVVDKSRRMQWPKSETSKSERTEESAVSENVAPRILLTINKSKKPALSGKMPEENNWNKGGNR